jgi:CheY-like chemotaxis protein
MDAIGRMAGGIAHDFNNLLTAINGFSALALSKAPEDSPIREELVEVAKAGERAASLTRQLLAFSRKQVLSPQLVDLNRVVEDIAAMIRRIIGEDVDLVTRLETGLPDIRIDPGQLEQIILNLAVNARDAMPAGGELAVETRSESFPTGMIGGTEPLPPGRYVMLSVSDKGVGMTPEVRERLFEPFFTTKEPGKGTGLGLSTVYGIVKQSEGQILVYSEPGKGSTFKLYFPAAADQAGRDRESAPGPLEKSAWSPSRAGSETILLVEDEAPVRKLVAELLEGAGYSVLPADDGVAALEAARAFQGPIHLLVTDVVMRNMGGQLLSRKLLEARPDTRILFMSGYTDESFLQMQVRNASLSFIQKPFSPSQLLAKVRQALDTPVS